MTNNPEPSATRRDFLTGTALRKKVEHVGGQLADATTDGAECREIPSGDRPSDSKRGPWRACFRS